MTRVAAIGALVAVLAAVAFLLLRGSDDGPGPIVPAEAYAAAWTRGDDVAAGRETDDPARAAQQLAASRTGLDGATVKAGVTGVTETDGKAQADLDVRWEVPNFGVYAYSTTLDLTETETGWEIVFKPSAIQPDLTNGTRLGTLFVAPKRAEILDRDGRTLIGDRPVVDIAIEVDRDVPETVDQLAAVLPDDVDARKLAKAVRDAPAGRFIPAVTLRRADYQRNADALALIPGLSLDETSRPLAPTRDFGRAVLGSVGPVTAEQLEDADRPLTAGSLVGQSGLSAAYDAQLAGEAARSIVIRDKLGDAIETLSEQDGKPSESLTTTLDYDVQVAAEAALEPVEGNAALVAIQPSTGDVLAVANRPGDSSYDRAIEGRYPPGSTFKVVTTAALLASGLSVDKTVDCPATIAVGGRSFRNFEGGAASAVPFSTDFAQSCNTAFISLAGRLQPDTLTEVGRDFGLGRAIKPGLPSAEADIPPATDAVSQAAMMIGQDRIVASPLNMAGVAATVAAGRWHAPRLVADAPEVTGPRLRPNVVGPLRTLMRSVVTSGTGTALAGVAGEPAGKSGTAEYGGGDPPPTHAWFIAYRGDLALAVLVEDGVAGGRVAAPLAAAFLNSLTD